MADVRKRVWCWIMYPESLPENWKDIIDSWHTKVVVSPLHEYDIKEDDSGELKKPHYHAIISFDGKKSYTQVCEMLEPLHCTIPQPVNSVSGSVRYLCHLDDKDKYQYSIDDVLPFCGFDLSPLYKLSEEQEVSGVLAIQLIIQEQHIGYFVDLCNIIQSDYPNLYPILIKRSYFLKTYLDGIYKKQKDVWSVG